MFLGKSVGVDGVAHGANNPIGDKQTYFAKHGQSEQGVQERHEQAVSSLSLLASNAGVEDRLPFIRRPHLPRMVCHALVPALGTLPVNLRGET